MDSDIEKSSSIPSLIVLDRTTPTPLYFQIAQQLERHIDRGTFQPGDPLPSEWDLSDSLGVSRPTVRQAIQQLAHQGLVVRRRGIGTVVIQRRVHRSAALSSFFDALVVAGRTPRSDVVHAGRVTPSGDVATSLQLETGGEVIDITRVRFADDVAIAVMHNLIPVTVLPEVPSVDELCSRGLYDILRARGVQLAQAHQEIAARRATAREATLLGAPRHATVLTMRRLAYDIHGVPVELGNHVYLAERYSFEMTLPLQ